jgi:hypothetical protein
MEVFVNSERWLYIIIFIPIYWLRYDTDILFFTVSNVVIKFTLNSHACLVNKHVNLMFTLYFIAFAIIFVINSFKET